MLTVTTSAGLTHTVEMVAAVAGRVMELLSRSVAAEPEIQMLAFLNYRRESADLGKGWFRDQTDRAPLQFASSIGICRWLKTVSRKAQSPASIGYADPSRSINSWVQSKPRALATTRPDSARTCRSITASP